MSTFIRIQITLNLAVFHLLIALSFKLQPLCKRMQIEAEIQYSYCSFSIIYLLKGEAKNTFTQSHRKPEYAILC